MTELPDDYKQRQKDWREVSINQLSITNNILITLTAGYLALVFDKNKLSQIEIDFQSRIDWGLMFYALTVFFILLSILLGVFVMLSRLYDFKISRHIALTRQRIYKKYQRGLPDSDFNSVNFFDRIKSLLSVIFIKIDYLTKQDIENFKNNETQFTDRFNNLRRHTVIFGTATWRWTKVQVGLTLVSIMTYLVHLTR